MSGTHADGVPLKALRVPAALDGSAGLVCRRARLKWPPTCRRSTRRSRSAAHAGRPRRAGWREAEQRLPWAIEVKGAPLSSLDTRH